jgi:hypothetical protein
MLAAVSWSPASKWRSAASRKRFWSWRISAARRNSPDSRKSSAARSISPDSKQSSAASRTIPFLRSAPACLSMRFAADPARLGGGSCITGPTGAAAGGLGSARLVASQAAKATNTPLPAKTAASVVDPSLRPHRVLSSEARSGRVVTPCNSTPTATQYAAMANPRSRARKRIAALPPGVARERREKAPTYRRAWVPR